MQHLLLDVGSPLVDVVVFANDPPRRADITTGERAHGVGDRPLNGLAQLKQRALNLV
jgi:hypothetical protein